MQEVTQAAQRLRRWKQDQFHCNMQQVADDRKTLADAYLAEHADDDEVAITESWLTETYGPANQYRHWIISKDSHIYQGWHAWVFSCPAGVMNGLVERGQLRLLLRALQ